MPTTWERKIDASSIPLSPQDYAFERVAETFGFNSTLVDGLVAAGEHTYWAALTEAVASCVIIHSPENVSTLDASLIQELHTAALDDPRPGQFLQDFANSTLVRYGRLGEEGRNAIKDANTLYEWAIAEFAPEVEDEPGPNTKHKAGVAAIMASTRYAERRQLKGLQDCPNLVDFDPAALRALGKLVDNAAADEVA